jgi:hypothetical protein
MLAVFFKLSIFIAGSGFASAMYFAKKAYRQSGNFICAQYILLTIEFSVSTLEASDEQYTGGGADPETHILNAKKIRSAAGWPNLLIPFLPALSRSRLFCEQYIPMFSGGAEVSKYQGLKTTR